MSENGVERWVSLKEVCGHLGVKRHTIMKRIETKEMPAVKARRLWKFKISEIAEWFRSGGATENEND